ncbi:hypothetical protein [Leisingera sp. ANG-M7]|uniref:hypothetical protein n=1 Tax=Leisingera sp. ANG-M7 TaxID=1577902 RepID=UPI0005806CC3|nr:hypothetical protein [Leisingera sp. ANG-M7]KIC35447.1 hypothetical protein RA26_16930 [Leisingera sp. ANG-M7]
MQRSALAGRVFLRAFSLLSQTPSGGGDIVLLNSLKLVLRICVEPERHSPGNNSELFWETYEKEDGIVFNASTHAIEFHVEYSAEGALYEAQLEQSDGSGTEKIVVDSRDRQLRHDLPYKESDLFCDTLHFDRNHSPRNVFSAPLSTFRSQSLRADFEHLFGTKAGSNQTWIFWRDWYLGFLKGSPLGWGLQCQVASIDEKVWDAGPEAVAAEIERIRAEFKAPPSGKERFPKHEPKSVSHLFENRIIASASLQGLAAQVTQSIERFHAETGANALPEALEPLTALPALLLAVNSTIQDAPSDRAIASETEDQLRAEIGRLNAKVAQLENELQKASISKPSVFSDAFKRQLGTSLGDWKLYAALCTGLWFVSGDAEGTQRRLENISHYRDMIFGEVSSPSKGVPARTPASAESTLEI